MPDAEDQNTSDEQDAGLKNPAAVALGKLGGRKGGLASAAMLSPEERKARARNAALVRWQRSQVKKLP